MILYIYKVIIGMVPNPNIEHKINSRTGINVTPKFSQCKSTITKKLRNTSIFVSGPLLYNTLPLALRTQEWLLEPTKENVGKFKSKLDQYLANIPDRPGTRYNSLIPNL